MSAPGPQSQDRVDLIEADRSRGLSMVDVKNVALVHGGFVDGSGWEAVYDLLARRIQRAHCPEPDDVAGR